MKRVVLEELLPGMVLAKAIMNATGLPVVPAGAELDSPIIARLASLGLTSIYVEGESGDRNGKTLAELQADLEHRFRSVNQDPVQRMIAQRLTMLLTSQHGVHGQDPSTAS